jgi:glucokinase
VTPKLYLGADTGGTGVKYVVTDPGGEILHRGEVATDPLGLVPTLTRLAAAVHADLVDRPYAGTDGASPLAAVGLACAGIVDPVKGRLGRSPNLPGWENTNLARALQDVFGNCAIVLANDVNAALYGEYRLGAGRHHRNLVMIALGTGVGGGLLIDGRLLVGGHCGAGEIGHMVLDPTGPRCTCGGRGCLEAYAGSTAILNRVRELTALGQGSAALRDLTQAKGDRLTTRDLAELAGSGDDAARNIFAAAGRRLGQAVGNLINVLDPDRVIIGGGVASAGELILQPCRDEALRLVLAAEARQIPIVPAELGPTAAAVGVACLAREQEPAR